MVDSHSSGPPCYWLIVLYVQCRRWTCYIVNIGSMSYNMNALKLLKWMVVKCWLQTHNLCFWISSTLVGSTKNLVFIVPCLATVEIGRLDFSLYYPILSPKISNVRGLWRPLIRLSSTVMACLWYGVQGNSCLDNTSCVYGQFIETIWAKPNLTAPSLAMLLLQSIWK